MLSAVVIHPVFLTLFLLAFLFSSIGSVPWRDAPQLSCSGRLLLKQARKTLKPFFGLSSPAKKQIPSRLRPKAYKPLLCLRISIAAKPEEYQGCLRFFLVGDHGLRQSTSGSADDPANRDDDFAAPHRRIGPPCKSFTCRLHRHLSAVVERPLTAFSPYSLDQSAFSSILVDPRTARSS